MWTSNLDFFVCIIYIPRTSGPPTVILGCNAFSMANYRLCRLFLNMGNYCYRTCHHYQVQEHLRKPNIVEKCSPVTCEHAKEKVGF